MSETGLGNKSQGILDGDVTQFSVEGQVEQAAGPRVNAVTKLPQTQLNDVMKRATFVGTSTLSSSDIPYSNSSIFPWQAFLANAFIADKTSAFQYIRGTLQVIGVVTVPGGAYGAYVASCYPRGGPVDPTYTTPHYTSMLAVDHCEVIDIATSQTFAFQLPFVWQYDYAATKSTFGSTPDTMWDIRLWCLTSVRSGLGGTIQNGTITWYASLMDDYELLAPTFQSKKKHPLKGNPVIHALAPHLETQKASQLVAGASNIAQKLESVPVIGTFAKTAADVLGVGSKILDYFGFTRDSSAAAPLAITNRSVTNVAHTDGNDSSDKATLTVESGISIDPMLSASTPEDQLSCGDFFDRWVLIKSITWEAGATGYLGNPTPITPSYCVRSDFTTDTITLRPTAAGYFGLPFAYWRGDMEYKFIMPTSRFHRGTIQFIWAHGQLPEDPTNTTYNVIHEVQPGQSPVVTIGWCREKPFIKNLLIDDSTAIVNYDSLNGYLLIRVVNPLNAVSFGADTEIYVFARGKNLQFNGIRDTVFAEFGDTPVEIPLSGNFVQARQ